MGIKEEKSMRFLVGTVAGTKSVFAVKGEHALNLSAAVPEIGNDLSVLVRDPALMAKIAGIGDEAERIAVSDIVPALPIESPPTIICLGLNYVDHIKEGGYDIPDYPALFMRGRNSLMAAGRPMVRPACSEQLDYEAELMVIIGEGGRHISEADALNHVFGYTVFNDGSVREYQRKTHQWTPGKNFDDTGAVGPVVVTPDEVPEGASGLKIESRVGDEILQSSNTANMIWGVARTIAIISEYTTLEPGEVIDIEIEGIGICSNPVVDEVDLAGKTAAE